MERGVRCCIRGGVRQGGSWLRGFGGNEGGESTNPQYQLNRCISWSVGGVMSARWWGGGGTLGWAATSPKSSH